MFKKRRNVYVLMFIILFTMPAYDAAKKAITILKYTKNEVCKCSELTEQTSHGISDKEDKITASKQKSSC